MLESREFLIFAAYAVTAAGISGLIAWVMATHRALRRALTKFATERKP